MPGMKYWLQNFTKIKCYLMIGIDTFQKTQWPLDWRMGSRVFSCRKAWVSLGMKAHGKDALHGHLSLLVSVSQPYQRLLKAFQIDFLLWALLAFAFFSRTQQSKDKLAESGYSNHTATDKNGSYLGEKDLKRFGYHYPSYEAEKVRQNGSKWLIIIVSS